MDNSGGLSAGVVITNCNTEQQLRHCVKQCDLHEPVLADFVVIDDASAEIPDPGSERVRLLRNPSNLGLVGSLNRGITECRADLVVVFDSDAYPLAPFVQEIIRTFTENPDLAMAAFATFNSRGTRSESTLPEPGVLSILLGQKIYAKIAHAMPPKPLCVFTCAMVVRKTDFLAAGGFDPQFDWLDLDLDLSMVFTRMEKSLILLEGLEAFHEGGGSPQKTSARVLRFYLNRWKLLKKHDLLPLAPLVKSAILARLCAEWFLLHVAGGMFFPREIAREKSRGRLMVIREFAKA
jgi:GT2 family glycosyltransferase